MSTYLLLVEAQSHCLKAQRLIRPRHQFVCLFIHPSHFSLFVRSLVLSVPVYSAFPVNQTLIWLLGYKDLMDF